MNIQLSDHFTYGKLIRFTLPSIGMIICMSVYGVVDGFFVSNFVGKTPFAAVNLIMPYLMILATVGFIFGAGGSALVAKTFGEGDAQKANRDFSLFVRVSFALGVTLAAISWVFLRPIAALLGAEGDLLDCCVTYGRVILVALPFNILQFLFQSFFVTAERPQMGLRTSIVSGVANMVLDAVLVLLLPQPYKLIGAAIAPAASQILGGVIPLIYFARPNDSILHLGPTRFDGRALVKACTNGASEFMSNISMSLVGILYNFQLIAYAGEDGVAAYGVMMYVSMIFCGVFIGYSMGTAPVVSFHFGAQNHAELQSLLRKSLLLIGLFSLVMLAAAQLLTVPLAKLFVGYDAGLQTLTVSGMRIFAFSFLFMGFAIYGSGFFTALNDGLTSAIISFLRTVVFQVAAVLLLPLVWDIDGVWLSVVAAEAMAVFFCAVFLLAKRKHYHY